MPAGAAVKQLRKNHLLPGGKHHASEGVVVVVVVVLVVVVVGVGVWTPLETLKRHLISCPKRSKSDREKYLMLFLKP